MTNMHNPLHPGIAFKQSFFDHVKLTKVDAAKRLGVSRNHLNNLLNGKVALTADMAKRLEALTGSSAAMWLNMQNAYDLWQLRDVEYNIERVA